MLQHISGAMLLQRVDIKSKLMQHKFQLIILLFIQLNANIL